MQSSILGVMVYLLMIGSAQSDNGSRLGIFEGAGNVGKVSHAGSVEFHPDANEYVLTGGGANVWGSEDAFQFAWRELAGDAALTASVRWWGEGRQGTRDPRSDVSLLGAPPNATNRVWEGLGAPNALFRVGEPLPSAEWRTWGPEPHPHRKTGWMIRQSLDAALVSVGRRAPAR